MRASRAPQTSRFLRCGAPAGVPVAPLPDAVCLLLYCARRARPSPPLCTPLCRIQLVFAGTALSILARSLLASQAAELLLEKSSAKAEAVAAAALADNDDGSLLGKRALRRLRRGVTVSGRKAVTSIVQTLALQGAGSFVMMRLEGWSFLEAFYWSTETTTTIGYGDIVPTGVTAKLFASAYMLVSMCVFARALAYLTAFPVALQEYLAKTRVLDQFGKDLTVGTFEGIFKDGRARMSFSSSSRGAGAAVLSQTTNDGGGAAVEDGHGDAAIGCSEFVLQMLLLLDKIDEDDVLDFTDLFRKLDQTGDGTLNHDDVSAFVATRRNRQMLTHDAEGVSGGTVGGADGHGAPHAAALSHPAQTSPLADSADAPVSPLV